MELRGNDPLAAIFALSPLGNKTGGNEQLLFLRKNNFADEDILLNYDDTIVSWLIIFARSTPMHIVTSSLDVRYCKILGYILPPVIFKTFSCQITVTMSFFIFLHCIPLSAYFSLRI